MNQGRARRERPPLTIRTQILGLILVTLLPLLAFSAFLVIRSAEHAQALLAATVQDRTRATAREIEQEVASLRIQLFAIANAQTVTLDSDSLQAFRLRANAAFGPRGLTVTLTAPDGRELLDTRRPPGSALPDNPDRHAVQRVVDTALPYASDLTTDPLTNRPAVTVNVPVMHGGVVAFVASLDVIPRLADLTGRGEFPPNWIVAIGDRQGNTIARSRDAQQYVGQPGRPDFLRRVRDREEGWFPYSSREGIPVYMAFSHVEPVGWIVVTGLPDNVLFAPVRQSTSVLLLSGGAMLMVALLLALLIGRRIARPIRGLVSYAELVGRGEPVPLRLTGLRETDAVACSLHRASENLHRSMAEREQATSDLHTSEQRKQVLQQAVLAQETERKRIARELHDTLGQYLTALQLALNGMRHRWSDDPEALAELANLRDLTSRIGCEVNRMAWELRPTALDDLGLEMAITQYLEEWSERSQLRFDVQVNLGDRRLPQTVETTVYRVLQEAVTNVVRHAEAENVAVILELTDHQLQLIVEDDGRGFPPEAGEGGQTTVRLGLLGIRERLALVDGSLEVETSPGLGTTLFMRVPV